MDNKIIKQTVNEWRSNIWLMLELLVVSVVLWFVVDFVYTRAVLYARPLGFDTENCFYIEIGEDDSDAEYSDELEADAHRQILARLQRHPDVEAACLSLAAHPYSPSRYNTALIADTLVLPTRQRMATPDFFRVFRVRGTHGETEEQLAEMLEQGKLVVAENTIRGLADNATRMRVSFYSDTLTSMEIGAIIPAMRYSNFAQNDDDCTTLRGLKPDQYGEARDFSVRVRPGAADGFKERLMASADNDFSIGPYFVSDVKSFDDIKAQTHRDERLRLRNYIVVLAFLLGNIFMGLLGTFWFRTQQRIKDIAIRKVAGATRADIFRLLLCEGLLLLTMATPLAFLIDADIAHLELNELLDGRYLDWGRLFAEAGITYALMAVMISLGISVPAWRATKIDPADALRGE
ncbi:MAG: ABC transporter permease [Muribaculaceae bacterium]|nr:ABC transporter permease [Muribaculaceae bacterium]